MASLTDTVEALLWEDESAVLDFKEAQYLLTSVEEKCKLLKDILAFANAFRREDAYILLGVREIGGARSQIVGVTHHLAEADLQQLVNSKTNRTLEFSYHAVEIDGKQVGVIRIPRQTRPIYLRAAYGTIAPASVYLRHGSSNSVATPEEIARMGGDQQVALSPRERPEITTLLKIASQADFYLRVIRLIENISRIPHHYITAIARPVEYEHERRSLHVRFNEEHDSFRQAMNSGRVFLTQQQLHSSTTEPHQITEILMALRDVEQSVSILAAWAMDRLTVIDTSSIPWDKKHNAEEAAATLNKLVAQRLVKLGAETY